MHMTKHLTILEYNEPKVDFQKVLALYHYAPLARWLVHKYKYWWSVGVMVESSSLQEKILQTYTLKLR